MRCQWEEVHSKDLQSLEIKMVICGGSTIVVL